MKHHLLRVKNRLVTTKLTLVFFVIAIIIVSVAGFQLFMIHNLKEAYSSLVNHDIQRVLFLHDISIATKDLRNKANRYIVNGLQGDDRLTLLVGIDKLSTSLEDFSLAEEGEETLDDGNDANRMGELGDEMIRQAVMISNITISDTISDVVARAEINRIEGELSMLMGSFITREEEELVEVEHEIDETVTWVFNSVVAVAVATTLLMIGLSLFITLRLRKIVL